MDTPEQQDTAQPNLIIRHSKVNARHMRQNTTMYNRWEHKRETHNTTMKTTQEDTSSNEEMCNKLKHRFINTSCDSISPNFRLLTQRF